MVEVLVGEEVYFVIWLLWWFDVQLCILDLMLFGYWFIGGCQMVVVDVLMVMLMYEGLGGMWIFVQLWCMLNNCDIGFWFEMFVFDNCVLQVIYFVVDYLLLMVFYWVDCGLGFVVVGLLVWMQLLEVVQMVYWQYSEFIGFVFCKEQY